MLPRQCLESSPLRNRGPQKQTWYSESNWRCFVTLRPQQNRQDPSKSRQDPSKRRQDPNKSRQDPSKSRQDPRKRKQDPFSFSNTLWRPHALWILKDLIATRRPMDPKVLSLCLRFAFALRLLLFSFALLCLCFAFGLFLLRFCVVFASFLLCFCFAFAFTFALFLCYLCFPNGGAPLSYRGLKGLIKEVSAEPYRSLKGLIGPSRALYGP